MDLNLMITSFPKLLNASIITLKLLSVSLLFGLFNLKIANNKPINKPKSNDTDNNFKVIIDAFKSFGKLVIIKFKSIKNLCCI